MQLEKKRDIYVDVSKGIAMLMVVSIHTEVFHEINFPYPIIAVPFFFFMSGFFDKSDKPLRQWIGKTSLSLIGTTVIWTTIKFVYLSFLNLVKTGFSVSALSTVPYLFNFGVAWFLVALFYAKILVWLFSKLKLPVYSCGGIHFKNKYSCSCRWRYCGHTFLLSGKGHIPLFKKNQEFWINNAGIAWARMYDFDAWKLVSMHISSHWYRLSCNDVSCLFHHHIVVFCNDYLG